MHSPVQVSKGGLQMRLQHAEDLGLSSNPRTSSRAWDLMPGVAVSDDTSRQTDLQILAIYSNDDVGFMLFASGQLRSRNSVIILDDLVVVRKNIEGSLFKMLLPLLPMCTGMLFSSTALRKVS